MASTESFLMTESYGALQVALELRTDKHIVFVILKGKKCLSVALEWCPISLDWYQSKHSRDHSKATTSNYTHPYFVYCTTEYMKLEGKY